MSDLFNEIDRMVKNFASSGDILLFDSFCPKKHNDVISDTIVLNMLYLSYYKESSSILNRCIENSSKQKASKKKRKQEGAFFTPPYIAEYICENTIGPMIESAKKQRNAIELILDLTICDPAMGSGIFLVCAHDLLVKSILEISSDENYEDVSRESAKCIYGVDINPNAVEMAKLSLNLNHMKWSLKCKSEEFAKIAV